MNTINLNLKNGKVIELMYCDFPSVYKWDKAKELCSLLGDGWRLPYPSEIEEIFANKEVCNFGNWGTWAYWTNEEKDNGTAIILCGPNGQVLEEKKTEEFIVRVVRSK